MKVAIVGASGAVGQEFLKVLDERNFPIDELLLFGSSRSAGREYTFRGKQIAVKELKHNDDFKGVDIAFTSAGAGISKEFAETITRYGAIMIDNSSAFRMDEDVPLVVPEVNPEKIFENKGIIANPNCSTIQAVVALKPLDDRYKIKRIVYSTYQAVSGAGKAGVEDLENGYKGLAPQKFKYPIFNNCLPHIDVFEADGYTKEEYKMINETRKILSKPLLPVTATCVRVPVRNCHSESINVEFKSNFDIYDVKVLLQNSPGIILVDDVEKDYYPLASKADGFDDVFVGRIRRDYSVPFGINLWVVADNLRKGAASNAVQILEKLMLV